MWDDLGCSWKAAGNINGPGSADLLESLLPGPPLRSGPSPLSQPL